MKLADFTRSAGEWLRGVGPMHDVVISSRIRLARNLAGMPFLTRCTAEQQRDLEARLRKDILAAGIAPQVLYVDVAAASELDRRLLVERHLISRHHAEADTPRGAVIAVDETASIMVNEEDHLRIQVMESGFDLGRTWQTINAIDDAFAANLPYAFSPEWGFLTACPTNTGTGMRGSVMLHLPALVMSRQINRVLEAIAKLSFTTRGLYGEGTQASGNFFQISNQVSLGQREEDILDNIKGVIAQIIEHEEKARQALLSDHREMLEDRIWRSYGTLKNAHIISSHETVELLSMLRLGHDLGIVKGLNTALVNELFILTQPAHLQKIERKKLTANERDVKRAEIIREKLAAVS